MQTDRQVPHSRKGPSGHLVSSPLESFTGFFSLPSLLNVSVLIEHIVLFLKYGGFELLPNAPA